MLLAMATTLKNGMSVENERLDRLYELDWRSLNYTLDAKLGIDTEPMYRPRSYTWSVDAWLDQGPDGACVGFAFAHDLIARPYVVKGVTAKYAKEVIYIEAQRIDPWPGGSYAGADPFYEGTSILAGAKICKQNGYFESYHWALTAEEVARGIAYFGPCVLGLNWYEGMFHPDPQGYIRPHGGLAGGHAILANAVKIVYKSGTGWWNRTWRDVDHDKSYVTIHNSWGKNWAKEGTAKLSFTDLQRLLNEQGDACFPARTHLRSVEV